MVINPKLILEDFKSRGIITEIIGQSDLSIKKIAAAEESGPGDLVFVDSKEYVSVVQKQKPSAIVTTQKLKDELKDFPVVLISPNVRLAHALIKKKYGDRNFEKSGWNKIHSSAVVHESALIGENTVVEPKAVIGMNSKIGNHCRIMAGAVIENDVTIDDHTIIHPNVVIGYGSKIGKEVVIESGSVIGSQGYGFAQDEKRKSYQIPQTGIVVLEDRVKVGANCCIDRAAYAETRIGAGTKLDNLCHVAHNVQIGEDCILTAFFCVAGSTKIGKRMIASGQTGIIDHLNITDDVVLLHKAGVIKDITEPGAYAGTPVQSFSDYTKSIAVFKNLAELKKRIQELEKQTQSGVL